MAKNLFDLENEIVVITGSSGKLGFQYSKSLIENNAKVVGLDLNENEHSSYLQEKFPDSFFFIKTDITKKKELENGLKLIKNKIGNPTALINNAAIDNPPLTKVSSNSFEGTSENEWDTVVNVNLKGAFLSCQVFGREFSFNKRGNIINISSIYGLVSPDQSIYQALNSERNTFYKPVAYSVTKSGILNLTRYLAEYWAKDNIRVNTLSLAGVEASQDPEFVKDYTKRIPIGRMARPEEYSGAIIFLLSQASSYMTGSNLVIDGGWTAI
jgi:NAD(P)-dependent dehydrogenase (short-subunit alcohol dehydrogenase family)